MFTNYMSASKKVDLDYVYDLFCKMTRYDMNYLYHGVFTENLTTCILSFAEACLYEIGESTKVRKKVYFIMVESLQNITRHESKESVSDELTNSFFIIQGINNGYFVTSGNYIPNDQIPVLSEKLEKINNLSPEELKEYSKVLLSKGTLSSKGGAGLGLIEMARKSGNKLNYKFEKIDDNKSFFYYQIRVTSKEESPDVDEKYDDNFENSIQLHKLLTDKNLNIVFQGSFSTENVSGVLQMIESGVGSASANFNQKNVYPIIVELLHNINVHSAAMQIDSERKPGIFLMRMDGDVFEITTGNLVATENIDSLKNLLNSINSMSEDELLQKKKHLTKINSGKTQSGHRIGLLDIRVLSKDKINYHFTKLNDEYSFFVIQLKV